MVLLLIREWFDGLSNSDEKEVAREEEEEDARSLEWGSDREGTPSLLLSLTISMVRLVFTRITFDGERGSWEFGFDFDFDFDFESDCIDVDGGGGGR